MPLLRSTLRHLLHADVQTFLQSMHHVIMSGRFCTRIIMACRPILIVESSTPLGPRRNGPVRWGPRCVIERGHERRRAALTLKIELLQPRLGACLRLRGDFWVVVMHHQLCRRGASDRLPEDVVVGTRAGKPLDARRIDASR